MRSEKIGASLMRTLRARLGDDVSFAGLGGQAMVDFAMEAGALGATLSGAGSAILVLTRTGELRTLEARLRKRVDRLWGSDGAVLAARAEAKGAAFKR